MDRNIFVYNTNLFFLVRKVQNLILNEDKTEAQSNGYTGNETQIHLSNKTLEACIQTVIKIIDNLFTTRVKNYFKKLNFNMEVL